MAVLGGEGVAVLFLFHHGLLAGGEGVASPPRWRRGGEGVVAAVEEELLVDI